MALPAAISCCWSSDNGNPTYRHRLPGMGSTVPEHTKVPIDLIESREL